MKSTKGALRVDGMSCAACVRRVETGIESIEGVHDASVNLATGRVAVSYDPDAVSMDVVGEKIREIGYEAHELQEDQSGGVKKLSLMVGGMTCAACVRRVESALKDIAGVEEASVNLAVSRATVTYRPDIVTVARLRAVIEDAGYEYLGMGEDWAEDPLEAARRREIRDLGTRVVAGLILSTLVMVGSMPHWFPFVRVIPEQTMLYLLLVLTTPAVFWVGQRFFTGALKALRHKTADMNTLVAMGSLSAYLYSALATFWPRFFTEAGKDVQIYYEGAAMIVALVLLGRYLELRTRGKTSEAIRKLMQLKPKTARVLRDGREVEVLIEEVVEGDILQVRPGERISTDGVVTGGRSSVDESMLTGESMPVTKEVGANVFAGTINQAGSFTFRATRVGAETALARIIRMVEEAQGSKAPIQRFADKVASIFVPVVVVIACITFAVWYFVPEDASFSRALLNFVSVLIISCPCAMGLATPTAVMVGTGLGANEGILIKGGESLEKIYKLDTVVFDKTGTLTRGRPQVVGVVAAQEGARKEVLRIAVSIDALSEHPLARAIVEAGAEEGISPDPVDDFEAVSGLGARGVLHGHEVALGSKRFFVREGIDMGDMEDHAREMIAEGRTGVYVAINGKCIGFLALADALKESAVAGVGMLKKMGLGVIMITGDREETAQRMAAQVGIESIMAEVMPGDKAGEIRRLQGEGRVVAMVGDGINDAPALAASDVGIAVGAGTDVALEAADITLMRDDLRLVSVSIQLSADTMRVIKQNLFWAFIYNTLGIPVAAGVLYPFWGILLNPMFAAAAMALSSVSVVTNALRLKQVWSRRKKNWGVSGAQMS